MKRPECLLDWISVNKYCFNILFSAVHLILCQFNIIFEYQKTCTFLNLKVFGWLYRQHAAQHWPNKTIRSWSKRAVYKTVNEWHIHNNLLSIILQKPKTQFYQSIEFDPFSLTEILSVRQCVRQCVSVAYFCDQLGTSAVEEEYRAATINSVLNVFFRNDKKYLIEMWMQANMRTQLVYSQVLCAQVTFAFCFQSMFQ